VSKYFMRARKNSRNDRLHSSFLKRQFREILDRTMVVPGKR